MCWFGRHVCLSFSKPLASSDAQHLQRLSPDGTETLLDHHLATFDRWLRAYLMSSSGGLHLLALAVISLLDQLDPEEYNPQGLSVILRSGLPLISPFYQLGEAQLNMEYARILSKFLMDRGRAGSLWVNPQMYVKLVTPFLKILRDK